MRDRVADLMSDALAATHVHAGAYVKALCNAHARRGFAELIEQQPVAARHALLEYRHIWSNDTHCRDNGLTADERRDYHHAHSLPVMERLRAWCAEPLESGTVEANSPFGQAMAYYQRHYEGLTAFTRIPGAPLDNNEVERLIKLIVRGRKNAFFFKTPAGAAISDVITSVLATCHENAVNAFDYLTAVQRNREAVRTSPEAWLPWCYPSGP